MCHHVFLMFYQAVKGINKDGLVEQFRASKILSFRGIVRVPVEQAEAGEGGERRPEGSGQPRDRRDGRPRDKRRRSGPRKDQAPKPAEQQ